MHSDCYRMQLVKRSMLNPKRSNIQMMNV